MGPAQVCAGQTGVQYLILNEDTELPPTEVGALLPAGVEFAKYVKH